MITREEYELLKQYRAKGYGWIARDKNCGLYAFKVMPVKFYPFWRAENGFHLPCLIGECGDNILTCVTWKDEEPTKINDLINDYESHQTLVGESMKVTVPQFVAEWIEKCKSIYTLRRLFSETRMPDSVKDWTSGDGDHCNLMARAWLDGYEIEKEKLYTVTLANGSCLSKAGFMGISWLNRGSSNITGEYKLTQSEIESVDPILMKIAKEVE